jgi:hypothetical protein
MPTPTIPDGELFFNATTYTGNGGTLTVTNGAAGQSFQPDFVWVKDRTTANGHTLSDSVRGAGKLLFSNATAAESGNSGDLIQSFNSNGFTVNNTYLGGSNGTTNTNGNAYVGWQWKAGGAAVTNTAGTISSQVSANTTSGFSVVTYTGTGSNATIGHGLGVAPRIVIVKDRDRVTDWPIMAQAANNGSGQLGWIRLNTTDPWSTTAILWNNTSPTSTVFSIGTYDYVNEPSSRYVAYCFSEVAGYSKFGSYTGNGSADGPFVYLGFRPKYVLCKRTNTTGDWVINDAARNPSNALNLWLYPNYSDAEATFTFCDFVSNGFKIRVGPTAMNNNGDSYIYMAFAENPFKYANAR